MPSKKGELLENFKKETSVAGSTSCRVLLVCYTDMHNSYSKSSSLKDYLEKSTYFVNSVHPDFNPFHMNLAQALAEFVIGPAADLRIIVSAVDPIVVVYYLFAQGSTISNSLYFLSNVQPPKVAIGG